ncbi:hypothetical protein D3C73_20170 [compost metagenome]
MAKIYNFEEARHRKFNPEPYVAPSLIENVPEDIQESLQINESERRQRSLKIAVAIIESINIPPSRPLTKDEQPPTFGYPPSEEK